MSMESERNGLLQCKWRYKAEGNKHIVVSNGKGFCLRLQKCGSNAYIKKCCCESTFDKDDGMICKDDKLDELKFIECVVLPLLNFSDACHLPKVVRLPEAVLYDLNQQISAVRPKHRLHQTLNFTAPALLMPDYCFIPSTEQYNRLIENGVIIDSNVFTVEIKLKKGYLKPDETLSSSTSICQFCKTQLYRVLEEKRHKRCSFYCPLDLFSGNEIQMKKALQSLFMNPQNNLRLFHNGELVYSQEILDAILSTSCLKDIDRFKSPSCFVEELLSQILKFKEIILLDPNSIVDILPKALLMPVVSQVFDSNIATSDHCNGEKYKRLLCNDIFCSESNFVASKNHPKGLPSNSILGLILTQQKLDSHSLHDLLFKLQSIELYINEHSDTRESLDVDAPYDTSGWKNFVADSQILKKCENTEL